MGWNWGLGGDEHEPQFAILPDDDVDISYIAVHQVGLMKLDQSCSNVFTSVWRHCVSISISIQQKPCNDL